MEKEKDVKRVSYEEWKTATTFARFRYKYALFVLIACWICLMLLIYFVWHYQKELTTHPITFALQELKADYCYCYNSEVVYYINSTAISYTERIFGG